MFGNLQSAICNLQSAICNLQSAIYNLKARPIPPCYTVTNT
ncbi:hypothetical protein [Candidatus Viridilinea mediisalina]|nr:hypothetical protein [Candidatus Viridilinea mediisalina]